MLATGKINPFYILTSLLFLVFLIFGLVISIYELEGGIIVQSIAPGPISIIKHNLIVASLSYLSVLSMGIGVLFSLFINGLSIGISIGAASKSMPIPVVLANIIPHGLLEIPGIITAAVSGMKPLEMLFRYLKGEALFVNIKQDINSYLELVVLSAALIIVAGFIESIATPRIAELVNGIR